MSALFANRESGITLIQELKALEGHLDAPGTTGPSATEVESLFKPIAEQAIIHRKMVRAWDREAQIKALKRVAIETVLQAARVAAALASQGYMLDGPIHARYGKDALEGLKEFEGGVYYKGLIIKLQNEAPLLDSHDEALQELKGRSRPSLLAIQRNLGEKAQATLMEWVKVQKEATEDVVSTPGVTLTWFTKPTVAGANPFLQPEQVHPFENALPVLDLEAAAGGFGEEQDLVAELEELRRDTSRCQWVPLPTGAKPSPRSFAVKVVGESMNRRIPNGSLVAFKAEPHGSRNGLVVLARLASETDPDTGGRFTVKVYQSDKTSAEDGTWQHREIRLHPDSTDPSFQPIVLTAEEGILPVTILGVFDRILH